MATQLDAVSQLASLLGGSRTTQTADTEPLRAVLAQLQGQDPAAGIGSLFQKATGQMPGIQVALGNAMGARRSNNGGIEAALQKLLQDTTLAAQSQVATQQQRNLETQGNVAANIAQASKTTQQKTNLGDFAKNLLLLQGLTKAKNLDFSKLLGSTESPAAFDPTSLPDYGYSPAESIMQPNGMDFNSAPSASLDLGSLLSAGPTSDIGASLGSMFGANAFTDIGLPEDLDLGSLAGADLGGGGLMDELASYGVFADGGLVGRDGKLPGFADGGSVTLNAAGGRRSSAPTVQLDQAMRTAVSTPAATQQATQTTGGATPGVNPAAAMSGNANIDMQRDYTPNALASGIRDVANNPLARVLMSLVHPALGAVAGIVPGSDTETREQQLSRFAALGLGMIGPELGLGPAGTMVAKAALSSSGSGGKLPSGYGMSTAPGGTPAFGISLSDIAGLGGASQVAPDLGLLNDMAPATTDTAIGDTAGQTGGSRGGFNGFGDSRGFSSAANTTGGNYGGGMSGGVSAASGGHIQGPGTGTSDSIPARLSDGEYVIPADVVDAVGVEFFDMLRNSLHTPMKGR